jgi:hypothetical protein
MTRQNPRDVLQKLIDGYGWESDQRILVVYEDEGCLYPDGNIESFEEMVWFCEQAIKSMKGMLFVLRKMEAEKNAIAEAQRIVEGGHR